MGLTISRDFTHQDHNLDLFLAPRRSCRNIRRLSIATSDFRDHQLHLCTTTFQRTTDCRSFEEFPLPPIAIFSINVCCHVRITSIRHRSAQIANEALVRSPSLNRSQQIVLSDFAEKNKIQKFKPGNILPGHKELETSQLGRRTSDDECLSK
jgi:hypothetical protein